MRRVMDGEAVTISTRTQAGSDALGQPTWEWEDHEVMALVSEATGSARSSTQPDSVTSTIILALPRAWDLDLRGARVAWRGRAYLVEGEPHHVASPLERWDMVAEAVMVDG